MKAVWLKDQQFSVRKDLPIPKPGPGEVLLKVLVAGICNTDLELERGYYPFDGIPGHEWVGLVVEGPPHLARRRVVCEINCPCHQCWLCEKGLESHCEKRTVVGIKGRNGAFAEFVVVPEGNVLVVPDEVATEVAVFCEPLAAALQIQRQLSFSLEEKVVVLGDGKLGQLVALSLSLSFSSSHLFVVGRHQEKLRRLRERGLSTGLVDDLEKRQRTFDYAIDCTGNEEGFDLARRALRPRGTLVLKSTFAGRLSINSSALVVDEITLVGSRCGPFAPALDLLLSGKIDVTHLIDHRYSLDEALRAFERAKTKGSLKVLIEVSKEKNA